MKSHTNVKLEVTMKKRVYGFTLIELLTVIAIIMILAALLTPVFVRARISAHRSSDMAKMNRLRSAIGLYKIDQGAYPPQLLGYVTLYATGPNAGNVIPADHITSYLYPDRVETFDSFQPEKADYGLTELTSAVYPNQDPRAVGTAPIAGLDLNGDGTVDVNDDTLGARQAYGPADGPVFRDPVTNGMVPGICSGTQCDIFYRVSGYDVAEVNSTSGLRTELRYTLFWSNYAIGTGPGNGAGSPFDDPRQLGYTDPPEDTVVTWNSYYREYDAGVPTVGRSDIILLLGGSAKPYDSRALADYAWRQGPLAN